MSGRPEQAEYLNMVLSIINRLAGNSVQMKTWTIPLVTGVFIFAGLSDDPHWLIGIGGCIPIVAFWAMDARYLFLEKCYRKLYESIINDINVKLYDMNYLPYKKEVPSVWKLAMSWSIAGFYGSLIFIMASFSILLAITGTCNG